MDFISGSYDPGDLYLFRGLGDGKYAAVEKILDKSGLSIVHHPEEFAKYSLVTDKEELYNEANTRLRVASFGSWPAAVDWDNDGDLDLLIGSFSGELFLRENEGTRNEPEYATECVRVQVDGKPIKVNAHCNPVVADWNKDGLWDLVVSAGDGSVWWHPNVGEKSRPKFAQQRMLVPAANDQKFLQQNLAEGEDPVPGVRAQICVTDYNLDGRLDLLVGDYSDINWTRELTAEEQAEFDKVIEQEKEWSTKMMGIQKRLMDAQKAKMEQDTKEKANQQTVEKNSANENAGGDGGEQSADDEESNEESEAEAHFQSVMKEYQAMIDDNRALREKKKSFYIESRRASFVWLYLRKDRKFDSTDTATVGTASEKAKPTDENDRGPVKISASAKRVKGSENEFEISVDFNIKDGWHIYGAIPPGSPYTQTKVDLNLPGGVSTVGDWESTVALPYLKDPTLNVYTGTATFARKVKLKIKEASQKIEIEISYQVCDDKKCLPPTSLTKSVVLR